MSTKNRKAWPGVRTLADIRARCFEDRDTKCLHWRLGRTSAGTPALYLPAIGQATTMATAICVLKTGAKPERGVVWHPICRTPGCCFHGHYIAGTKSSQMLSLRMARTPLQIARISLGKRRLDDDAIADICASHGEPLATVAARHGISVQYACQVRSGSKRPMTAAPASSVFAWRAAA